MMSHEWGTLGYAWDDNIDDIVEGVFVGGQYPRSDFPYMTYRKDCGRTEPFKHFSKTDPRKGIEPISEIKIDYENEKVLLPNHWEVEYITEPKPKPEFKPGDLILAKLEENEIVELVCMNRSKTFMWDCVHFTGVKGLCHTSHIMRHATDAERKQYWKQRAEAIPDGTLILCVDEKKDFWIGTKEIVFSDGEIDGCWFLGFLEPGHKRQAFPLPKGLNDNLMEFINSKK